ncbi:stage III sporulation protein SpoIIIAB [Terrilactibacillus laevilacticus]|uniref:stage III sporulation protein SpoIIIAB n=1 Tax=Terrilactibacillus laevilacticus TaxID=1380157 RepID=UPI0011466B1F|nr:stage III sporulation protein SpoIIIAB [Terrilactibacillus laevilacticus]
MLKPIGAILIILTTTWMGFIVSKQYSDRPKQLRQLRSALQSLEAEIVYGLTPIQLAAEHLATQLPKPLSIFFKTLSNALVDSKDNLQAVWENSIHSFWPNTALKKNEKEILLQFGATLGKQDSENQTKQIQLTLAHLEREEKEARVAQTKYEKMSKSLGFLSGILIVLLLI